MSRERQTPAQSLIGYLWNRTTGLLADYTSRSTIELSCQD